MAEKPKIRQAIAVEGRYDAHAVRAAVDAYVVELGGFHIFKHRDKVALLRHLAEECGLIILTDSDRAGNMIRSKLKGQLPGDRVQMAYIPAVLGKERRKRSPGKDGLVGVEGMDCQTIREALRRAGATFEDAAEGAFGPKRRLTRELLFEKGLLGGPDSQSKRAAFAKAMGLPPGLSVTALVEAVNAMGGLPADMWTEEEP